MIFEMFVGVFFFFKSVLTRIIGSLRLYGDSQNINVEILYLSNDYIIVNKPEDVFTNNHGKHVSDEPYAGRVEQYLLLTIVIFLFHRDRHWIYCWEKSIRIWLTEIWNTVSISFTG